MIDGERAFSSVKPFDLANAVSVSSSDRAAGRAFSRSMRVSSLTLSTEPAILRSIDRSA